MPSPPLYCPLLPRTRHCTPSASPLHPPPPLLLVLLLQVRTPYDIRLTTSALAALLASRHPALDAVQVKGKRLDTEGAIRTRARARAAAEQWSWVPLRVRLVVLLTDAYIEANAQGGLGRQRVVCVEACV